ncbi:MAG: SH3 domain-containing protein [Candidatus Acidiferrales bacterium]
MLRYFGSNPDHDPARTSEQRQLCQDIRRTPVIRKMLLGFAVVLVVVVGLYVRQHHTTVPLEIAYSGNHLVTVYSTSAQVREPVTTVNFGERLEVLQRFQDQVKVRTPDGVVGWVAERDLLSADSWQRMKDMETKAEAMAVEARGHTRVLSNLHFGPGRDTPRIRQLNKDVALDLLMRQTAEIKPAIVENAEQETAAPAPEGKKEDWWFVRAHTADQATLAGWVLGRFIDLDVPQPLPDYASSAGMRIVAWTQLDRVTGASGKPRPQYLLVGTHGPEGQPCDFTMLRVYTWGKQKERYETAFVESDVCGKLPIERTQAAGPGGDVTFSFQDLSGGAAEKRTYQMHQTIVRRVREAGAAEPRKHRR